MKKIRIVEKSLLDQFCAVLDPLQRHIFFAKIPYFNYQLNFQSSHLTKKETEDASKRLSSYCMGALNCIKHSPTADEILSSESDSERVETTQEESDDEMRTVTSYNPDESSATHKGTSRGVRLRF